MKVAALQKRKRKRHRGRYSADGRLEKLGCNPAIPEAVTIAREARAWDLYRQGHSQAAIAAQLEEEWPGYTMTQQAVSKALQRCEDRTLAELKGETVRETARQLNRLEGAYLQAMAAWHRSKAGTRRTTERQEPGRWRAARRRTTTAAAPSTTVQHADSAGDPRFLEKALQALTDRRRILGLDAPTKFEGTVGTKQRPLQQMTPEELEEQIREGERLLKAMGVTVH